MPYFSKEVFSQYIRTGCQRQLALALFPDHGRYTAERLERHMPPPQPLRSGLEQLKQAGYTWEAEKLYDLTQTFGQTSIIGHAYVHDSGQIRYHVLPLQEALAQAAPHYFLIQTEFDVGPSFTKSQNVEHYHDQFNLNYAPVRPDIIEVLPPLTFPTLVAPSGAIQSLPSKDKRLQLRIIDIKLTAEPSPSYFAEAAYYIIVLAGWLVDNHLSDNFVAIPNASIWPGSHGASSLTRTFHTLSAQGISLTREQLYEALEEDLEAVPYEAFALRLRHFLQRDLYEVLRAHSWRMLEWHVGDSCKGCPYLGFPSLTTHHLQNTHPDHCIPMAETQDHISRIAFIPRGAATILQHQGIQNVTALSQRSSTDPIYNAHQSLRATRTLIASRATSLRSNRILLPSSNATSAMLPRWADLHIYIATHFDLGSTITFAFGVKAFWSEPHCAGSPDSTQRATHRWEPVSFIVDQKDLLSEERELLSFLRTINNILDTAKNFSAETTVQIYLWDKLQYEHFMRVIGRHLRAILQEQTIQHLAWLFPSEELLPNYKMIIHKSPAIFRKSPVTIIRNVVRSLVAAPVPHYYSLLNIARCYHTPHLPEAMANFTVHPLFEDILSDQIPSERAHEIWSRMTQPRSWLHQIHILEETVKKHLSALETVTQRLEMDLKPHLNQYSPLITIGPPKRLDRLSTDSQLWYAFAKLDEAQCELDVQQVRAMPPYEREARFSSARLTCRLDPDDEQRILSQLHLPSIPGRRAYKMRPESREVKLREGDFHCALAPEQQPGFLDQTLWYVTRGTTLEPIDESNCYMRMETVTGVTVVSIDRDQQFIVLDLSRNWLSLVLLLEQEGLINLSTNVILDPIHRDHFTGKLKAALRAIGNPPSALDKFSVRQATGQMHGRGAHRTKHIPPEDILWDAEKMYTTRVYRNLVLVRLHLMERGLHLNEAQWQAWEEALTRRLFLIWGPPGTGKSRTVKAIAIGAALEAYRQQKPLRILLCASTYTAIDNVLQEVYEGMTSLVPKTAFQLYRLRSSTHLPNMTFPNEADLELNMHAPSQQVLHLRSQLAQTNDILIVGATPEQIHNLLMVNARQPQDELFDIILIDEASQMDVAHAILALCSLATDGSVVLAGDPLQLPPIHQAEAPVGLEKMVGSIYDFCNDFHHVPSFMLDENYRSNKTLVSFLLQAGYKPTLRSFSPELRLQLLSSSPKIQPANWPRTLYWTSGWESLLDPAFPATCFVYPEGLSSQWNTFEADAVSSLVFLLYGRVAKQALNERDAITGAIVSAVPTAYSPQEFWERAIGIVTPHRAQQGLIISRLQSLFAETSTTSTNIRSAVDTVERFQGQQRDIIIASFALGDPDTIQDEEAFIMSLHRFNVMVSRARAKIILLISRQVVDHLSHDIRILRESQLLKRFVDSFCQEEQEISLGFIENGSIQTVAGLLKRRR